MNYVTLGLLLIGGRGNFDRGGDFNQGGGRGFGRQDNFGNFGGGGGGGNFNQGGPRGGGKW